MKIKLTKAEMETMKKVRQDLLHNSSATTTSNQRSEGEMTAIANKYNVDTQIIWDLSK